MKTRPNLVEPREQGLAQRRLRLLVAQASQVPAGIAAAVGQRSAASRGINLVHYAPQAHQGARVTAAALDAGVQASGLASAWFSSPSDEISALRTDPQDLFDTTVAYVQPANLPLAAARHPRLFSPRRRVVSLCYWETTEIKSIHRAGFPLADEIWTLSSYCQEVLAPQTSKPVKVMPHPVVKHGGRRGALREELGLRDEFLFGFQFDMLSTTGRKNPEGVISAYRNAFPSPDGRTALVIKVLHGTAYPTAMAGLQRLAAGRPDIQVIDAWWPDEVNAAFYVDIDAFISLHRSEGFGLGMAQAMAAGKPVVATAYSGNLDFMNDRSAVLVPYTLREVGPHPLYSARSRWAEPDLDAAADALRSLAADQTWATELGQQAEQQMQHYSVEACGRWIAEQIGPG